MTDETIAEDFGRDYAPDPVLDHYSSGDDEGDFQRPTAAQRRSAARALDQRDGREGLAALDEPADDRALGAFALHLEEEDDEAFGEGRRGSEPADVPLESMEVQGSPEKYFAQAPVRGRVQEAFVDLLYGDGPYVSSMHSMCIANDRSSESTSFKVDFEDLPERLQLWAQDYPAQLLPILNEAALKAVLKGFPMYGENIEPSPSVAVRLVKLPEKLVKGIRELRVGDYNRLCSVPGVVVYCGKRTPVLRRGVFKCSKCHAVGAPVQARPAKCDTCQSARLELLLHRSQFRDTQRARLQEDQESTPRGQKPNMINLVLEGDLVDTLRVGKRVDLVGVPKPVPTCAGSKFFGTELLVHSKSESSDDITQLSDTDIETIRALSKEPRIADRIVASMAPSIHGHLGTKRDLACCLFGGVRREDPGAGSIRRGDIHMLMIGDPGTAKSQFLGFVRRTGIHTLSATGRGASGPGLTAAVVRDSAGRFELRPGALPLASDGHLCVDEFDKMNGNDMHAFHEAMEQQTISTAKAGIVSTLRTRTSVVAAANPTTGRWDTKKGLVGNTDLTDPILSRFDIIRVIRDVRDEAKDERLATAVVATHASGAAPVADAEDGAVRPLPHRTLRKYMYYAREHCKPTLVPEGDAAQTMHNACNEMRQMSKRYSGGINMTVRNFEGMVRIATGHAKMHLRLQVNARDAAVGARSVWECFLESHRWDVHRCMQLEMPRCARGTFEDEHYALLMHKLNDRTREQRAAQPVHAARGQRAQLADPAPAAVFL